MRTSSSRRVLYGLVTSAALERTVHRIPRLEEAAFGAARRYVAGTTVDDALGVAAQLSAQGLGTSLDLFGESVAEASHAEAVTREYVVLAKAVAELPDDVWLSIDLSHVGLDISADFCLRQLETICAAVPAGRRLQVGAEDASRTERTLDVVLRAVTWGAPLTMTVQANLRRSLGDAERLAAAEVPIRLVKGAYPEPAHLAHPWGEETDLAYLELAHRLHRAGAALALATHDPVVREALLGALGPVDVEMLLGVRGDDAAALVRRGIPVRIHVPYGDDWFRYFMRRLAESRGTR